MLAPREMPDVVEHRARRVRGIGRVHLAAGEIPDEPGVDGARGERAALGHARDMLVRQQPLELGRGEVRIGEQPGARRDVFCVRREREAARGGAPILPHDRSAHGLARVAIPQHECLALIRDADGRRRHAGHLQCVPRRVERAVQYVERLVLDVPRSRIVLRDLAIAASEHTTIRGDDEARRAGGAGVYREYGLHAAKATA